MRTLIELLDEIPALRGLSARAPRRRSPAARATACSSAATRCCARAARPTSSSSCAAGSVAIETEVPGRGAVTVETLHAGDVLGWSWLLPPYRSAFGARALGHDARARVRRRLPARQVRGRPGARLRPAQGDGRRVRRAPAGHAAAAARPLRERRMAAIADGRALLPVPLRVLSRRRETHDTWTIEVESGARLRARPVRDALRVRRRRGADLGQPRRRRRNAHTIRAVGAVTEALCARRRRRRARPVRERVAARRGAGPRRRRRRGRDRPRAAAARRRRAAGRARPLRRDQRCSTAAATRPSCSTRTSSTRWGRELDVAVTVDAPLPGWGGPVGVVTKLIARAALDPERTVAMMCGPEVMMRFAAAALRERGVPRRRDLGLARAQHEVRRRPLRPLPARPAADLPRRRGVPPRPRRAADGGGAAVTRSLAVWKFASCDGCQLSLLDCEDELLPLAGALDIAYFLEAGRAEVRRRLRRLDHRGLDHHRPRRRAHPRDPRALRARDRDRRVRERGRDPGAAQLRRRRRLRVDRLREPAVHLDPGALDARQRARAGRLRAAGLPARQGPAARGDQRLPQRPQPGDRVAQRLRRVQAARQRVRDGRARHAVPRAR